jgi:DNA-directed RNA polymerase specialized sigma24 family protein
MKKDPVAEFLAGRKAPRLTAEQEKDCHEKALAGDAQSMETLICSQAHWIWTLCHRHHKPKQLTTDDLFHEAISQAYLAMKNFHPDRGRLSSFLSRVIPRKCSDFVVKTCSTFGKRAPAEYISDANSFLLDEDGVKSIVAELKESNVYEDSYYDDIDDLAAVVISILSDMEQRSRWIVAKRIEGKTAEEIANEETMINLKSNRLGRITEPSNIMLTLHAIRREILRELLRRDIPLESWVPGSKIGQLFDIASSGDQNRLFD